MPVKIRRRFICFALSTVVGLTSFVFEGSASAADETKGKKPSVPQFRNIEPSSRARIGNSRNQLSDTRTPAFQFSKAQTLDMIVASIDGEPLTASELRRHAKAQGVQLPEVLSSDDAEVQKILHDLVNAKILEKEAEKSGVSVSQEEVKAYVDEIKRQNKVDDAALEQLLQSRGLTLDEYKKQVVEDILKTRVVGSKVRSRATVVDQDVDRYLAEHPDKIPEKGELHVYQVSVDIDGSVDEEQAEGVIKEIREKIVDGESCEKAGGEHFTDLGFLQPGDLREEYQKVVSKLELKSVSDVVSTPESKSVFMVVEKNENAEAPHEIREAVRSELQQEKLKGELEKFLNEELPKKYDVEYRL